MKGDDEMGLYLVSQKEIDRTVESLLGIPYQHNGRNENGLDCWGLVYLFFKKLGYDLPQNDGNVIEGNWYKLDPGRYYRELNKLGKEVGHFHKLRKFDIPYFNLYKNVITHSGVMLDKKNFIHVLNGREVEIASFDKRFWRRKYKGAIRLKNK